MKKILKTILFFLCVAMFTFSEDGTLVGGAILPYGQFPTHFANRGFGGWHSVTNHLEIPDYLKTKGMIAYNTTDENTYMWDGTSWNLFLFEIADVFGGVGTTGLVTSTTSDTNKFLRGDGVWEDVVTESFLSVSYKGGSYYEDKRYNILTAKEFHGDGSNLKGIHDHIYGERLYIGGTNSWFFLNGTNLMFRNSSGATGTVSIVYE